MTEDFVCIDKKLYMLKEVEEENAGGYLFQTFNSVNRLFNNKIVVLPSEWELFLTPFAKLCYDKDSPYNQKGPVFFACMLFMAVEFRISEDSIEFLDMQMIDIELQKLKNKVRGY